jgi:hypothetical protein
VPSKVEKKIEEKKPADEWDKSLRMKIFLLLLPSSEV